MTITQDNLDTLAPGSKLRCTVATMPAGEGQTKTIARLMRRDPDNKRGLDRAQHLRKKRLHRYIRGNRLWTSREKSARVVRVFPGESWTMPYTPDIRPDLASVSRFLTIESA